uniref:CCHC-type domain-containing protein n=1 Tax=Astyanax mexicanus TaxID=7994 RepID=A0A3B1JLL1_ASTMX
MATNTYSQALRVKYWAKLKYVGCDEPPERNIVGRMILDSQWISVQDLLSFIGMPNKRDYEVCFKDQRAISVFLDGFSSSSEKWKDFEVFSPMEDEVKTIIVKFWTGRICDEDVEVYLKRYCEILKPVIKPVDNLGLWYGVRKYTINYPRQITTCFVCNSEDHQAKECQQIKCWQCGDLGHKSKHCTNISLCSLCGEYGHNYFRCPSSYANKSRATQIHTRQEAISEVSPNIDNETPPVPVISTPVLDIIDEFPELPRPKKPQASTYKPNKKKIKHFPLTLRRENLQNQLICHLMNLMTSSLLWINRDTTQKKPSLTRTTARTLSLPNHPGKLKRLN